MVSYPYWKIPEVESVVDEHALLASVAASTVVAEAVAAEVVAAEVVAVVIVAAEAVVVGEHQRTFLPLGQQVVASVVFVVVTTALVGVVPSPFFHSFRVPRLYDRG